MHRDWLSVWRSARTGWRTGLGLVHPLGRRGAHDHYSSVVPGQNIHCPGPIRDHQDVLLKTCPSSSNYKLYFDNFAASFLCIILSGLSFKVPTRLFRLFIFSCLTIFSLVFLILEIYLVLYSGQGFHYWNKSNQIDFYWAKSWWRLIQFNPSIYLRT